MEAGGPDIGVTFPGKHRAFAFGSDVTLPVAVGAEVEFEDLSDADAFLRVIE